MAKTYKVCNNQHQYIMKKLITVHTEATDDAT